MNLEKVWGWTWLIAMLAIIIILLAGIIVITESWSKQEPYPTSKYHDLLNRLSGKNFLAVHDCDFQTEGIRQLLTVERAHNINAIYFIRPDADYFSQNVSWFQELESQGVTFGFHYDCLSRASGNILNARALFTAELAYLRMFLNITYTRSHGDNYNLGINNHGLYNEEMWNQLKITDLSNECGLFNGYVADTNRVWSENLTEPILVNLHSDYW